MKRLLSACLAAALMLNGAGAYQVPNAGTYYASYLCSESINNDPTVQADFLHALGLFRGTEKGYELEKAMTRAEAAAMLTRFLGAEKKALAGEWKHPFTDVPAWAAPYVGWLYQNGLTKGVSAKEYGAAEPVTVLQFATFLSRAVAGNDDYRKNGILDENEQSNAAYPTPMTRAMAVALSTRALPLPHTAVDGNYTMAQFLYEQGAFTEQQFTEAAWDVLPPTYRVQENGDLVCTIAGIESARNTDGLTLDAASATRRDQGTLYAYTQKNGKTAVYAVDPKTLRAAELGTRADTGTPRYLGMLSGRDYLLEASGALLSCDGKTLAEVLPAAPGGFTPEVHVSDDYDELTAITVTSPNGIYVIRQENQTPVLLDTGSDTKIVAQSKNDNRMAYLVTGPEDGRAGSLRCFDLATGELTSSLPVAADAVWQHKGRFLYGGAGLLEVIGELYWMDEAHTMHGERPKLKQWTGIPVYEVETVLVRWDAGPSEPYVLTGASGPEKLISLKSDGTMTEILAFDELGLTSPTLAGAYYDGDFVRFHARNGQDAGIYTYLVINSSVRPVLYTPDTGTADSETMCAAEQARLDALISGGTT